MIQPEAFLQGRERHIKDQIEKGAGKRVTLKDPSREGDWGLVVVIFESCGRLMIKLGYIFANLLRHTFALDSAL